MNEDEYNDRIEHITERMFEMIRELAVQFEDSVELLILAADPKDPELKMLACTCTDPKIFIPAIESASSDETQTFSESEFNAKKRKGTLQ